MDIRKNLSKAIIRSQHCQRNWDLDKVIPQEDLDILKTSLTQAPSLQNVAFYKVHFIQDRETIEKVHAATHGAPYAIAEDGTKIVDPHPRDEDKYHEMGDATQSQTLANLVVVFEDYYKVESHFKEKRIADEPKDFDKNVALGIVSGYLNLTAQMLGYATGCCLSMDHVKVKEALDLENDPLLIMGVGFKQEGVSRRKHHVDDEILYPTNKRQEVPVVEY